MVALPSPFTSPDTARASAPTQPIVSNARLLTGMVVQSSSAPQGEILLIAGSDAVILRSIDGGHSFAQAQTPSDVALLALAADASARVLVAVGDEGTILRSEDDGATWQAAASPVDTQLRCVGHHAASETWIAAGAAGTVLRSTDDGRTWTAVASGTRAMLASLLVPVSADAALLLAGEDGALLASNDAGLRWAQAQTHTPEAITRLIESPTHRSVYATGSAGSVLRSIDGGRRFHPWLELGDSYISGGHVAVASGDLWLVTAEGSIVRASTDAQSVEAVHTDPGTYLSAIHPFGEAGWIALGDSGRSFRSIDAGRTWQRVDEASGVLLETLLISRAHGAWISFGGGGLVVRSTDAGESWSTARPELGRYLHAAVRLQGTAAVVAIGAEGQIVRSEDGGRSFSPVEASLSPATYLYSIVQLASGTLLSAGPPGTILRSTDAGLTWQRVRTGESALDGYFHRLVPDTDRRSVVALAGPGSALRSHNDGLSFEPIQAPTDRHLFAGLALRGGGFVAVGQRGAILRSENGEDWETVATDVAGDLYSIVQPTPQSDFFVLGEGGTLLRSSDAGWSWRRVDVPADAALHSLVVTPTGAHVVIGGAGTVLRSRDGDDESWMRIATPTASDLRQAWIDPSRGVVAAVGRDGTLLESNDDGLTWTLVPTHTRAHLKGAVPLSDLGATILFGERLVRLTHE